MALTFTSNDVIGSAPGGPEGRLSAPAGPPSDDFKRQISDASTVAPDTPMFCSASPDSVVASFPPPGSMSPMMHYDLPDCELAETSSEASSHTAKEPAMVSLAMADGTPFQLPIMSALLSHPPADRARFGGGVDEDEEAGSHADEGRTEQVEKEGIAWLVARGRPPTVTQLEDRLAEVKSLYQARFGEDADEDEEEEAGEEEGKHADEDSTEHVEMDGITWLVARGRPPTVSQLEDKLAEVKSLYQAKFGEDADEDEDEEEENGGKHADEDRAECLEKDGIKWLVSRGRPPTLSQLENRLAEVKSLYQARFGNDVDEEEDEDEGEDAVYVEKDGITWVVARGRPPTMPQLEDRLAEVKSLYKAKFGEDVDEEEDEEVGSHADGDRTEHVEKDGITWVVARGRPPTISQLEDRLAEVKSLYRAKFEEDVDEEEDEEEEDEEEEGKHADGDRTEHVEMDGITWVVARGRPPTVSQLEDRLAEVKSLYKAKFGEGVDEEEEAGTDVDEGVAERVKKDGITWVVARGRPPMLSQLEDRLAEVKSLYEAKFGEDVDDEGDEEDEEGKRADEDRTECLEKDGITWVVARGRPPAISQLEDRLAEVKSLYRAKFGEDVDGEAEEEEEEEKGKHADEDRTEHVEKEGITWVVARGNPPTMPQLEDRLAEVKSLYKAKFGEDVDEEEEAGADVDEGAAERVKKDGIMWVVARGRPPTISQLEDRLAEVKSLYEAKFGEGVDGEEEEELGGNDADRQRTASVETDSITWVVARGRPPTMPQLEEKLAAVKSLYKAKFGDDVDEEELGGNDADEDGTKHVEKDGITWVVARGRPPTMSQLEDKLADVKSSYTTKFGRSVDDDDEEEDRV